MFTNKQKTRPSLKTKTPLQIKRKVCECVLFPLCYFVKLQSKSISQCLLLFKTSRTSQSILKLTAGRKVAAGSHIIGIHLTFHNIFRLSKLNILLHQRSPAIWPAQPLKSRYFTGFLKNVNNHRVHVHSTTQPTQRSPLTCTRRDSVELNLLSRFFPNKT